MNSSYPVSVSDLDISEVSGLLKNVIKTDIVPFLWGPPGIGKSTIVKELAKAEKYELIDLRLSLLSPVDLRGLPVVDKDNKQASWYPPSFFPKFNTKTKGILFLDEINLAPPSVQAAAYQLILDKQVGEYKFPKTWKIIAAGNRESDNANVYQLSAPLANRFIHFDIHVNPYMWIEWAKKNNINKKVISFINNNTSLLSKSPDKKDKAFATPRSWVFVSNLLEIFGDEVSENLKRSVIGAIGAPVGQSFLQSIIENRYQKIEQMYDNFIRTGDLNIPSIKEDENSRFHFIKKIVVDYSNGSISQDLYEKFLNYIDPEERTAAIARVKYLKEKTSYDNSTNNI